MLVGSWWLIGRWWKIWLPRLGLRFGKKMNSVFKCVFFFISWIFLSDHSWFYIPLWIFIWVYLYTVTKYVLTHLDPCNFLSMIFSCLSLYLLIFLSRSLFSKGLKFLLFILVPILHLIVVLLLNLIFYFLILFLKFLLFEYVVKNHYDPWYEKQEWSHELTSWNLINKFLVY
jgi:hypothetical protein